MDENKISNPEKDKKAKLFLEPSNELCKSLIKGNSAKEAVKKFRLISKKNLMGALSDKGDPMSEIHARAIWSNMSGLVAVGNENLSVS